MFTWSYSQRNEGDKEPEAPEILGLPEAFIQPLNIHLEEVPLTYEELRRFIRNLQQHAGILFTVHCFKNDSGKNAGFLRVTSEYEMDFTIYFMDPNKSATSDSPEGMPGTETC
jgi:hypothetical protein